MRKKRGKQVVYAYNIRGIVASSWYQDTEIGSTEKIRLQGFTCLLFNHFFSYLYVTYLIPSSLLFFFGMHGSVLLFKSLLQHFSGLVCSVQSRSIKKEKGRCGDLLSRVRLG